MSVRAPSEASSECSHIPLTPARLAPREGSVSSTISTSEPLPRAVSFDKDVTVLSAASAWRLPDSELDVDDPYDIPFKALRKAAPIVPHKDSLNKLSFRVVTQTAEGKRREPILKLIDDVYGGQRVGVDARSDRFVCSVRDFQSMVKETARQRKHAMDQVTPAVLRRMLESNRMKGTEKWCAMALEDLLMEKEESPISYWRCVGEVALSSSIAQKQLESSLPSLCEGFLPLRTEALRDEVRLVLDAWIQQQAFSPHCLSTVEAIFRQRTASEPIKQEAKREEVKREAVKAQIITVKKEHNLSSAEAKKHIKKTTALDRMTAPPSQQRPAEHSQASWAKAKNAKSSIYMSDELLKQKLRSGKVSGRTVAATGKVSKAGTPSARSVREDRRQRRIASTHTAVEEIESAESFQSKLTQMSASEMATLVPQTSAAEDDTALADALRSFTGEATPQALQEAEEVMSLLPTSLESIASGINSGESQTQSILDSQQSAMIEDDDDVDPGVHDMLSMIDTGRSLPKEVEEVDAASTETFEFETGGVSASFSPAPVWPALPCTPMKEVSQELPHPPPHSSIFAATPRNSDFIDEDSFDGGAFQHSRASSFGDSFGGDSHSVAETEPDHRGDVQNDAPVTVWDIERMELDKSDAFTLNIASGSEVHQGGLVLPEGMPGLSSPPAQKEAFLDIKPELMSTSVDRADSQISFSQMSALLNDEPPPVLMTPSLPATSVAPERAPSEMSEIPPHIPSLTGGKIKPFKDGSFHQNLTSRQTVKTKTIHDDQLLEERKAAEKEEGVNLKQAMRQRFDLNQYVESDYIGSVLKSKKRKVAEVIFLDEEVEDTAAEERKKESAAMAKAIREATQFVSRPAGGGVGDKEMNNTTAMPPPPPRNTPKRKQRSNVHDDTCSQASSATDALLNTLQHAAPEVAKKRKRGEEGAGGGVAAPAQKKHKADGAASLQKRSCTLCGKSYKSVCGLKKRGREGGMGIKRSCRWTIFFHLFKNILPCTKFP